MYERLLWVSEKREELEIEGVPPLRTLHIWRVRDPGWRRREHRRHVLGYKTQMVADRLGGRNSRPTFPYAR